MCGKDFKTLPIHVIGRRAGVKDCVEHKLNAACAGADDEVDTGHGLRKTLPRVGAHTLDT
jgi:hypothetical protein